MAKRKMKKSIMKEVPKQRRKKVKSKARAQTNLGPLETLYPHTCPPFIIHSRFKNGLLLHYPILSHHAKRHVVTIGKHKLDKDSKHTLLSLNVDDIAVQGQAPPGVTLMGVRPLSTRHPLLPDPATGGEDTDSSPPSSFLMTSTGLSSSQQSVVSDDEEEDDWVCLLPPFPPHFRK